MEDQSSILQPKPVDANDRGGNVGGGSLAFPLSVNEACAPSVQAASNGAEEPDRLDRERSSWNGGGWSGVDGLTENKGGEKKRVASGVQWASEVRCAGSGCSEGMDGWAEGVAESEEGFNGSSGGLSVPCGCLMRTSEQKETRDKSCASWPEKDSRRDSDIDRGPLEQAGKRRLGSTQGSILPSAGSSCQLLPNVVDTQQLII